MSAAAKKAGRRAVALAVVSMMVMSTAQAVAAPGNQYSWELPALQKENPVAAQTVTVGSVPLDSAANAVVQKPVEPATYWPAAASGQVDLGAAGTTPAQVAAQAAGTPLRIPGTPLAVGLAAAAPPGSKIVKGQVRDRVGSALVFTLADGGGATGLPLVFTVDYKAIAKAFGGDYGSRLRLVQLPACAVTTPALAACQVQTPVEAAANNTTAGALTGRTTLGSTPTVFAAVASASGPSGSFAATSLAPAGSWTAGGASGDFTYSYPLRVPPAIGGAAPSVALGYSAQSLDGRTSSTNNQASWVGDGWDMSPGGYVERQYKPCSLDLGGNNGQTKTGDQCWATDNATISLAGVSGKLVNIPGTQEWRAQNDDGARVERLFGAANGDDNGEHWKVTTTDGTQYFLGANRLPGWTEGKPETRSTWTTPVFGNHDVEPCHQLGNFDGSWCRQAYRWNLDYSIDRHGNVTTYYYNQEINNYGRNSDPAKGTPYVRGGWLDRVEYGLRDENFYAAPAAKVNFETAERCLPTATVTCDPAQLGDGTKSSWPDVPFDQICKDGESCTHRLTPSFFSTKRLTKVVTRVAQASGGYQDVDSWTLEHQFLATGDGLAPALNLRSIVHTGLVGGSAALPATVFSHRSLANRVDIGGDHRPPITRYRIEAITGEAGSHTQITYADADCAIGSRMPASPESNNLRCYPTWWAPDGAREPELHWFHKYVVASIVEDDRTGASQLVKTRYTYIGDPMWHFDENEFADPERRTWSQWRGYETVRTTKGETPGPQTVTEVQYQRGMDGDRLPGGAVRDVWTENSEKERVEDVERLRGFVRETRQYNAGELVSASVNDPYLPDTPTATDAAGNKAFVTGNASVRGRTKLSDGTWRRTRVDKQFTAEGIAWRVEDHGDTAVPGDESCTTSTFARNEDLRLLTLAHQVETVKGDCSVAASPTTILSLARSYYDDQPLGTPPTRGLITKAEVLDKWDASGQSWVMASRATYDKYGRPLDVHNADDKKTTTTYTPADGPLTEMSSTNPLGHVSREFLNPAWGTSVASSDVNNRRATLKHDPLGRLTAAWTPGRDPATTKADAEFEYHYNNDKASVVVSKRLQDNNQYLSVYTLYDGLLRERQTQSPAPNGGRQVSDTYYDSRGLPYKANGVYWNSGAPSGALTGAFDNEVPGQTITEYDGMGRPVKATFRKLGVEQWSTVTSYGGDRVHTTPPRGGTATTVITDAQGRALEKRQYTDGLGTPYDATKYTYTAAGQLETVTDPAGNVWRYTYDLRGRVIATDDPDTGHSTTTYTVLGQIASTTDSQGRTIANRYDDLGRQTARYEGSTAGKKVAEWEYDTLTGGVGLPTLSRRLVDGHAYERKVYSYDPAGRPTGETVTIPTVEGVLGTTYTLRQTYTPTGKPFVTQYNAVVSGGKTIVPREAVGTYYNDIGLPNTTQGNELYVAHTGYSSFGEVLQEVYGSEDAAAKNVWVTNTYETGSRRLTRTQVDRETQTDSRIADRNYTYDQAGNITRIADTPQGRPADIQCFAYDYLRRMNEAWTPSSGDCAQTRSATALGGAAPYWNSWTFDKTGNRLTETQHKAAGDTVRTTTYPAAGAPQPHTARSVTTTGPNGTSLDTFDYDNTGRTKSRKIGGDEQKLEYDAEGNVSRIVNPDGKESRYLYDADGGRLISREPSATTLHVFGQEIRLDTGTTTPSWTRQYSHNGHVVAVRNSVTGLKYMVGDHQGTNQLAVTAGSMEIAQRRQTPYGALRGDVPPWPDKLGFVGGRNDESGLTSVGARLYDSSSGRFLSVDPVMDNNDPQQLNGYAYANNSPVTFSDPTGMIRDCGPDGVLCGRNPAVFDDNNDTYDQERNYYRWRERAWQQASNDADAATRAGLAEAGISWEDYQRALTDAHKTKWDVIKEVAWEVLKDISGWNDIVDCFTKGDIWGCAGVITGLVPWGKVGKILEAGYNALKAVNRLAKIIDKAKGVLRRVQAITEKVSAAITEKFNKLTADRPPANCLFKHSFVAGTLVLMADGSTKPIEKVEIGEKVKATDPSTGETTDREVVRAIVHDDEGDMTRLTVTAEDGATGTIDATSWHPVWVGSENGFVAVGDLEAGHDLVAADGTKPKVVDVRTFVQFEPVYDLTVAGVHTYHVVVASASVLVHNCGDGDDVHLDLTYMDEWSDEQIAAADAKVEHLNGVDLVVSKPQRGSRSASTRYRGDGNAVPDGSDVDHMTDLQLGGADTVNNMSPLDRSVNRSLGAQIHARIRHLPAGTRICGISICEK
ncbi:MULTISPECIES: RHS repeat-associated core domain-containing protein [unclassified Saccharothrix]|uniref:RHS repeat-associated core domain-containing protein n=1 Tax=unclassified Saccharothrix TaxID=2593673 RepID=UPI00307D5200